LDITTSSIKLIELTTAGGQYRWKRTRPSDAGEFHERKTLVDPQAVGEAIRRAVKRSGATSGEVRSPSAAMRPSPR